MANEVGEILVNVKQEGAAETGEEIQNNQEEGLLGSEEDEGMLDSLLGGGDGEQGGGNGLVNVLGGLGTKLVAVIGSLAAITGLLLSLEPIQEILSAFMNVLKAYFIPLALVIVQLLEPDLSFLIRLLPLWYKFLQSFGDLSLGEGLLSFLFPTTYGAMTILNHLFPDLGIPKMDILRLVFPVIPAAELINKVFQGEFSWQWLYNGFRSVINSIIGLLNNIPLLPNVPTLPSYDQAIGNDQPNSSAAVSGRIGKGQANVTQVIIDEDLSSLLEKRILNPNR